MTSSWIPILGHLILFSCAYSILYIFGEFDQLPNNQNLLGWDAVMYESIKTNGYFLGNETRKADTGFFPFFPLVWRWLGITPIGITIVNLLIFSIGLKWLAKEFDISNKILWLALSMPSVMFFFLPYTESFFFISSTMILIGWKINRYWLVIIGTILACISRPSFIYLIAAIFFCFIYFWKSKLTTQQLKFNIYSIMVGLILGFLLQLFIFYIMTGNALIFFESRSNNNSFSIPKFPLTTWRGTKLLWLDGLALIVCLNAFIACVFHFLNVSIKENYKRYYSDFSVIFSLGYIAIIIIHILFFNIKDPSGSTSLLGLNRFVFTSPFFILLLHHFWPLQSNEKYLNKWLIGILAIGLLMLGILAFSKYPEQLRPVIYLSMATMFWIYREKFQNIWMGFYFCTYYTSSGLL